MEEAIDTLEIINREESDKAKAMSRWGTYVRWWLMYVACYRFKKSQDEILTGTYEHDLFYITNHSLTVKLLKRAMRHFVFDARVIIEPELSAQIILKSLLDRFVPAVVHLDDKKQMTVQDKKAITLIPENYINDYRKVEAEGKRSEKELLYHRILIATDFISGMTDGYARDLYRRISGVE